MTLTVNGHEAEPGCYVDGHWGQYAGVHLLDRAFEFANVVEHDKLYLDLTLIDTEWPRNNDGSRCGAYGSDRDAEQGKGTGPWAAIQNFGDTDGQIAMELSDEVLELLNEHTEGGYWEWWEGEVFLRSYVCPECGRDCRVDGAQVAELVLNGFTREHAAAAVRESHAEDDAYEASLLAGPDDPCNYCCDADDPGCFA